MEGSGSGPVYLWMVLVVVLVLVLVQTHLGRPDHHGGLRVVQLEGFLHHSELLHLEERRTDRRQTLRNIPG